MMAIKVAFISSLERSGSTILDLKLSSRAAVIGFGEVWRVISPHGAGLSSVKKRLCTCGEIGGNCSFWASVFLAIESTGAGTLTERYEVFLDVVKQQYGEHVVVVDSSKSIHALDALFRAKNADVYVLFTIRDVRGWISSIRKAEIRKREMPWRKVFDTDFKYFFFAYIRLNILRLLPLWLPNEWLLRNLRILGDIKKKRLKFIRMSYEELVFESDSAFTRIEKFLDIDDNQESLGNDSNSLHIIRGNRAAFTSDPSASLYYDTHWMSSWRSFVAPIFLPWVAWYNKKWVYAYLLRDLPDK